MGQEDNIPYGRPSYTSSSQSSLSKPPNASSSLQQTQKNRAKCPNRNISNSQQRWNHSIADTNRNRSKSSGARAPLPHVVRGAAADEAEGALPLVLPARGHRKHHRSNPSKLPKKSPQNAPSRGHSKFQSTGGSTEGAKSDKIPESCAAANEGAAVERRLEAGVAEFVVVVVVVVHRPVHLREIALDLLHGDAGSPSRLGPGDPARVEALGNLQETGAPVPICSARR